MSARVHRAFLIVGLLFGCVACCPVSGQTESESTTPAQAKAELSPYHKEALTWLDGYRKVQVLFHKKDIARVRKQILEGSSDEAQAWLTRTKEVREALDSDQWKDTQRWLREFLKVQAIYSDEHISQARDEAQADVKLSPEKFIDLLIHIEELRAKMVGSAANASELREKKLQIMHAYKKNQAAERLAARKAASSARPASSQGASGAPVAKKDAYRPPSSLVDSMDVARWSVMRNFWGR